MHMACAHRRRSRGDRGDTSPRIWSRGDDNANCPPQILSYKYKNERSVAFKIRQNPFSAGAPPRTPLGELTTLPRPPSRLKREHPSPYTTPLGTNPPSALVMRPPEFQPDLRLCMCQSVRETVHRIFCKTVKMPCTFRPFCIFTPSRPAIGRRGTMFSGHASGRPAVARVRVVR